METHRTVKELHRYNKLLKDRIILKEKIKTIGKTQKKRLENAKLKLKKINKEIRQYEVR